MRKPTPPFQRSFFIVLLLSTTLLGNRPGLADAPPAGWAAPGHDQAQQRSQQTVPLVEAIHREGSLRRSERLHDLGLSIKAVKTTYFYLNSPLISAVEDHYEGVRFNHGQHAAQAGDCSVCHHLRPEQDVEYSPHPETVRCSACHQKSFDPRVAERPGLKAAYHQRCIGCHKQQHAGPQVCTDCHLKQVPDHTKLVKLPDHPDALQVTAECLRCHEQQANDMLHTAHWLWRGPSPYTQDRSREVMHGKGTTALNNY